MPVVPVGPSELPVPPNTVDVPGLVPVGVVVVGVVEGVVVGVVVGVPAPVPVPVPVPGLLLKEDKNPNKTLVK